MKNVFYYDNNVTLLHNIYYVSSKVGWHNYKNDNILKHYNYLSIAFEHMNLKCGKKSWRMIISYKI